MRLGLFTKIFARPTLGETLDAVRALGITHVQFNSTQEDASIREQFERHGITLEVLSATYNIIHPDLAQRRRGLERFTHLAQSAQHLGASILSICTGTCDPEDMWRKHPDNDTPAAWHEMLSAMSELAAVAQQHNVTIAFEPEQANIINSAAKARTLLDTLKSSNVKVLIDAANLLTVDNLPQQDRVLKDAFDLLGTDIIAAHAKEFSTDGKLGNAAIGTGALNFQLYTSLLQSVGFQNSLIMHGFPESAASQSITFLRGAAL